jgi:hypothetical protein
MDIYNYIIYVCIYGYTNNDMDHTYTMDTDLNFKVKC